MDTLHPKTVRRLLLERLYERYFENPLEMAGPEDFLSEGVLGRKELVSNMHYLHDRQLVELMMGYAPPMFVAARITPQGIDMVENRFEFNLRFPPLPGSKEEATAGVLDLLERMTEEAEFAPLDGEERQSLLRDVQYLRDELARPVHRWRANVIFQVMEWISATAKQPAEYLPSLALLRHQTEKALREESEEAEA